VVDDSFQHVSDQTIVIVQRHHGLVDHGGGEQLAGRLRGIG
jgi:hypothetical protein